MKVQSMNHCWHWSKLSSVLPEPMEECCNCDKVIKDIDKWNGTDNGKCEWEILP